MKWFICHPARFSPGRLAVEVRIGEMARTGTPRFYIATAASTARLRRLADTGQRVVIWE